MIFPCAIEAPEILFFNLPDTGYVREVRFTKEQLLKALGVNTGLFTLFCDMITSVSYIHTSVSDIIMQCVRKIPQVNFSHQRDATCRPGLDGFMDSVRAQRSVLNWASRSLHTCHYYLARPNLPSVRLRSILTSIVQRKFVLL